MTDRTRQNLGGVVVAVAIAIVGLFLRPTSQVVGGVLLISALLIGVVCLLGIGLDLMKKQNQT